MSFKTFEVLKAKKTELLSRACLLGIQVTPKFNPNAWYIVIETWSWKRSVIFPVADSRMSSCQLLVEKFARSRELNCIGDNLGTL